VNSEIKQKKAACNRAWAELERAIRRQNKAFELRKRIHDAQKNDRSADLRRLRDKLAAEELIGEINQDVIRLSKEFDRVSDELLMAQQAALL
jgi:hypothetical protein